MHSNRAWSLVAVLVTLTLFGGASRAVSQAAGRVESIPGMPPVTNPTNLYSETTADKLSPALANVPTRVYVPNVKSHEVHVIDPKTLALQGSVSAPRCGGINHGDYAIDGRYLIMTCEYASRLVKIDWRARKVLGYLTLPDGGIPQDVRVSPDGAIFYVADLKAGGVHLVDGDAFKHVGFIKTGVGTHGLYPSRDGTKLYVTNRGFSQIGGKPGGGKGSVAVVDFSTRQVDATWTLPRPGGVAHGAWVYDDLTARENLRFGATVGGLDAYADDLTVALAGVGLERVADARVRTFSAGMKRRLSLARVMLARPRVLLLDEPFAGLDQRARKWLEGRLEAFKAAGAALLMVTHSLGRELGVADRLSVLAGGRIALDTARGSLGPDDVLRLYAAHAEEAL